MKTGLIVTAVALTLAGSPVFAVAAQGQGGCDNGGHWGMHGGMEGGRSDKQVRAELRPEQMQQRLDRLEKALSLNEPQRLQVGELMAKRAEQMPQTHAQMQQLRTQMQSFDPGAADYQQQVAALVKQKTELMSKQMLDGAALHAQIYALLTPEQQQAFSAMASQRDGRWDGHRGEHHRSW